MSKSRKQIPLRLTREVYERIAAWAADDYRSLNGQIEYLLRESLKRSGRLKEEDLQKE